MSRRQNAQAEASRAQPSERSQSISGSRSVQQAPSEQNRPRSSATVVVTQEPGYESDDGR